MLAVVPFASSSSSAAAAAARSLLAFSAGARRRHRRRGCRPPFPAAAAPSSSFAGPGPAGAAAGGPAGRAATAALLAAAAASAATIVAAGCDGAGRSPPPPPPSFGSAAAAFQRHMSKEKEDDESGRLGRGEEENEGEDAAAHASSNNEGGEGCFLCRVHRQGPCGPLWKEMEACLREARPGGPEDQPCLVPLRSFRDCWRRHSGLYSLVALDEQGSLVKKMRRECDVASGGILSPSAVAVDWAPWRQFLSGSAAGADIVKNYRRRISQNGNVRYRGPLWKRFEKHKIDPYLVTVVARVPARVSEEGGASVSHAVAVDQQGRVLGFLEAASDEEGGERGAETLQMKVVVIPGLTETVQVQLWTAEEAPGGAPGPRRRRRFVVHEAPALRVDYGPGANEIMALQNRRTRTERARAAP